MIVCAVLSTWLQRCFSSIAELPLKLLTLTLTLNYMNVYSKIPSMVVTGSGYVVMYTNLSLLRVISLRLPIYEIAFWFAGFISKYLHAQCNIERDERKLLSFLN